MTNSPQDLVRGSADLLVLSVLDEGPAYGYWIAKLIAARSDGQIKLSPGVLYPLLHQMEKQGLLLSSWEVVSAERNNSGSDDHEGDEADVSGRKRKWYKLSAKGRRRLQSRIIAHRTYQRVIESFLPSSTGSGS